MYWRTIYAGNMFEKQNTKLHFKYRIKINRYKIYQVVKLVFESTDF